LTNPEPTPPPGEDVESGAPGGQQLAPLWRRGVALLVDLAILGAVSTVVFLSLGGDLPERAESQQRGDFLGINLTLLGVGLLYMGLLSGSVRGQTPGKAALQIRVRDATTGGPIGPTRGLVRFGVVWLLYQVLTVPAVIDSLYAIVDPRRQTWHDKAARSVVVLARGGATGTS
jgi:uncharacterized RDD family membrane protein YckC